MSLVQSKQEKRSKSTSFKCSNVFIVNCEHNSHRFPVFLMLNLNRKMFIGTASFDYDTISIYCIINFYINFLQTIKCCSQVHVQATSLLKKISIEMLLGYGYMRNNLVHLRRYPNHRDVADMSNLSYFYSVFTWSRGMTRLPRSCLS